MFGLLLCLSTTWIHLVRQQAPRAQQLAFSATWDGERSSIYRMWADGSGVRRVIETDFFDGQPVWSPDGRSIAFLSSPGVENYLYVTSIHGGEPRRLALLSDRFTSIAWSPDGQHIAFVPRPDSPRPLSLFVLDVANPQQIRYIAGGDFDAGLPVWSARGLAFFYNNDIYLRRTLDGENERITNIGAVTGSGVTWAGEWIGFMARFEGDDEIYRVHIESKQVQRMTNRFGWDWRPRWSPDGETLIFESGRILFGVNSDIGTGQPATQLTPPPWSYSLAAWSPDGRWLALVSDRFLDIQQTNEGRRLVGSNLTGENAIYRMQPDGSALQQLTPRDGVTASPMWAPIIDLAWRPGWVLLAGLVTLTLVQCCITVRKLQARVER